MYAMNCSRCKSHHIRRSARKTLWDNLKSKIGLWPYFCEACGHRFVAARRYPPAARPAQPSEPPIAGFRPGAMSSGPEMACRRDQIRPTAKVVIQADDHVQLDRILMALHSAVSSYQANRTHEQAANRQ